MSNGDHVRPGEVISSSLINQILDRLSDLENAQPGPGPGPDPGGPISITGFDPAGEQQVGAVLAILGSNLPFPPTASSVTVNNVPVPAINLRIGPSTRERLEFIIPDIGTLPSGGDDVFIRVFGDFGNSAQRLYHVLPSSGGPPTPIITDIRPVTGNPNAPIPMGDPMIIEGSNFSTDSADNTITFTPLGFTPPADTYPPASVTSTAADEIQVVVPDMAEVELGAGTETIEVHVEVADAPDSAVSEFLTFRTS